MIISNDVVIKVNARTKSWFISKGYDESDVVVGKTLKVNSVDLNKGSNFYVDVQCDYCNRVFQRKYCDYYTSINKNKHIKKYSCSDCSQYKIDEIRRYEAKNMLLKIGDKGYWNLEENRINELKKYISKYKYLDKIDDNPEGKRLAGNIRGYEEGGIKGLAIKAGFNIHEVYKNKASRREHSTLEEIVKETEVFIKNHNRFPSLKEYKVDIGITQSSLNQYGGVLEVKKHMKYVDEFDLVDNRGFYNRSLYEYIVAQFLIKHGIPYGREVLPFPSHEGSLRSDFSFELDNGEVIYCEVWGYSEKDNHKRAQNYIKSKNKKIKLYKKYNLELISINYELFQSSYSDIISALRYIFSTYLNLQYKDVSHVDIMPKHSKPDELILKEIMKLSDDDRFLPTITEVIEYNHNLYYQIIKRYGTYLSFAKKFNKQTHTFRTNRIYWTLDKVFEVFKKMIDEYGYILSRRELNSLDISDMDIKRVQNGTGKFGGMTKCRLTYYNKLIDSEQYIPRIEIDYLKEVARIIPSRRYNVSDELRQEALDILKKAEIGLQPKCDTNTQNEVGDIDEQQTKKE